MNSFKSPWHQKLDALVTALAFIAVGLLLIGKNIGIIDYSVYRFFVSWQMLLIVIGITQLIEHKIVPGAILITIGVYFLFPRLPWWPGQAVFTFWPVVFIFTGIVILLTRLNTSKRQTTYLGNKSQAKNMQSSQEGFVTSEVTFGSAHQIVFDPYFKGARLWVSFGNIILDLRKTKLEDSETFIDIDCSCGGIEILVPPTWQVIIEMDTALAGCHDKRYHAYNEMDLEHKLIIRGKLSISGLEIKN
ncbi:MAG: cell wall-active antibiotics response protein [Tannerellaceae bacterium]|nr:cell wall-active antibiotics response protein [Tannerellaceae bacterium]